MKKVQEWTNQQLLLLWTKGVTFPAERWRPRIANAFLLLFGFTLLCGGFVELSTAQGLEDLRQELPNFDPILIDGAVGSLFELIEGSFGALVMVVAGLGAIIAAAMGAYRASLGMLVVAVGSFILRSLVSLFFGRSEQFTPLTN